MTWLRRLIGAMPSHEMEGIALANAGWRLSKVPNDAARFVRALPELVSGPAFLFLEGGAHPEQLRRLLEHQNVEVNPRPALGTLWPRHSYFIVPVEPAVLEELAMSAEGLPYPEVCDHLHVFSGDQVLVSGYDAFSDPFRLSAVIPEERVMKFSSAVGCVYGREVPEGAG